MTVMNMRIFHSLTLLLILLLSPSLHAERLTVEQVPEPLQPWIDWVLHDSKELGCPFQYNSSDYSSGEQHRCRWPARLSLNLTSSNGLFAIRARTDIKSWLMLPGDNDHWPQSVTVDGQSALVMADSGGRPAIRLSAGLHTIKGQFQWQKLPDHLTIPADSGLVMLTVNSQPIPFPIINKNGRLWLRATNISTSSEKKPADRVELQVYRKVIDATPLELVTRIELDVSGRQREIRLTPTLLPGFIPIDLNSPLPARLEERGELLVQLRPGRWVIELTARYPGPVKALTLPTSTAPWPKQEVWVFAARHQLQLVEVEGVTAIDPQQTNLPNEWKMLPAYQLLSGEKMQFKLIRRGDPEPEPDRLTLERTLWLDFDGAGYTVNDRIRGAMRQGWRLNVQPELKLGSVTLSGEPQLITTEKKAGPEGVEVRLGAINLSADSRIQGHRSTLHAVGWAHDFHSVKATLLLPPGWRLFSASGVDHAPDSWLQRWTLLDLFLVLIIALAVGRLWNGCWGLIALAALVLTWHEPNAPRYVWLNILAAIALLRVLPPGRLHTMLRYYRLAAQFTLLLIALPFIVDQIRIGLYPQLERSWQQLFVSTDRASNIDQLNNIAADAAPASMMEAMEESAPEDAPRASGAARKVTKPSPKRRMKMKAPLKKSAIQRPQSSSYISNNYNRIDPQAHIQTGPGLPQWRWNRAQLQWSGPVDQQQTMDLTLLSPTVNRLLNFSRVTLLALLALLLFERFKLDRLRCPIGRRSGHAALLALLLVSGSGLMPDRAVAADFPDNALLETLQQRLLTPPDCLPDCAQIPLMSMTMSPTELALTLTIHAQQAVSVPLPSGIKQWLPQQVTVDGAPAEALYRTTEGTLWLALTAGQHTVVLNGQLPPRQRVVLPLPLKPHRVVSSGSGWQLDGILDNGVPADQLQLNRIHQQGDDQPKATLEPGTPPPFVRVERTLQLGLEWRIQTVVRRLTAGGSAIVLELPLLDGESVITDNIRVKKGRVQVNMSADQQQLSWQSMLKERPKVTLTAPQTDAWTELWQADISPIWHATISGIPMTHHQASNGRWMPQWRPWPGESVTLTINRPPAVKGRTLTIDTSDLQLTPGKRAVDSALKLVMRSSQGGQHSITLPPKARLQSVLINGKSKPVRQKGRQVTLPIKPGKQSVVLNWRETRGISSYFATAPVNLGISSVNSSTGIKLGEDRWVLLTGGPQLGPAVLFWGVLLVIALLAIGLSKMQLTPLKVWHWFLLLIGLSQIELFYSLLVIGWLIALGLRLRCDSTISPLRFNTMQVALVILTLVALPLLFHAVKQGLLGHPAMQIAGYHSTPTRLNWYQDQSAEQLPTAWLISLPLMVYRILMLLWSLWMAYALLQWLRWGWSAFATNGLWKQWPKREKRKRKNSESPKTQETTG